MQTEQKNTFWQALKFSALMTLIFVIFMFAGIVFMSGDLYVDYTFWQIAITALSVSFQLSLFGFFGLLVTWGMGIWQCENSKIEKEITI
jgi:hypothetical protein